MIYGLWNLFFSQQDMSANILIILPLKINLKFEMYNDYLICIPSVTWVLKIARRRCETDFYILFIFHFFSSAAVGDLFRWTFKFNYLIKCLIFMLCYVYKKINIL